jgi:hypothetical protein
MCDRLTVGCTSSGFLIFSGLLDFSRSILDCVYVPIYAHACTRAHAFIPTIPVYIRNTCVCVRVSVCRSITLMLVSLLFYKESDLLHFI